MLAVVAETTERVEGERRLTTLRDLARHAADAKTPVDACSKGGAILGANTTDIPFALFYLLNENGLSAKRVAAVGLAEGHAAAPETLPVTGDSPPSFWPLAETMGGGRPVAIEDVFSRFGPIASGPHPEPVHTALLLPLSRPGSPRPYGFLVIGISARRALDDRYRSFLELAAEHVTTAIANARALEDERRRADALAEIDRAKTAFFSNVSHEFRTPLTLMLGPLEDLLENSNGSLTPEAKSQLKVTHRNSLRLLKLVNALLDFSRIESGRLEAHYRPVDMSALTRELAGVFRAATEKAGLLLVVDCQPLGGPAYVDPDLWEKIVFNLMSNALKFTLSGEIRVSVCESADRFELTVRDTGVGIASKDLPHLFTRFHRIENSRSRTHEGTGIGLALAQEPARLHGGAIEVESRLGHGTAFTVSIPKGRAHLPDERVEGASTPRHPSARANPFLEEALHWVADEPPQDRSTENSAEPPEAFPARILVADDNADMRDYVRRLLQGTYDVEAVPDGSAALDSIRRDLPDLVITDVMMPRLDGFGLLKAIRATPETQALPVIVLSARAGTKPASTATMPAPMTT